ncbi:MAG TPA: hypothetical protein DIW61_08885 [Candidatus Aminicenantes bacterium]|nr:hypothetical protein [Candidatus Aminicenantes bacterium]
MSNTNASLSIIVPAYNSQGTIMECLRDLRREKRNDDELIVIDDRNFDDTASSQQTSSRDSRRFPIRSSRVTISGPSFRQRCGGHRPVRP